MINYIPRTAIQRAYNAQNDGVKIQQYQSTAYDTQVVKYLKIVAPDEINDIEYPGPTSVSTFLCEIYDIDVSTGDLTLSASGINVYLHTNIGGERPFCFVNPAKNRLIPAVLVGVKDDVGHYLPLSPFVSVMLSSGNNFVGTQLEMLTDILSFQDSKISIDRKLTTTDDCPWDTLTNTLHAQFNFDDVGILTTGEYVLYPTLTPPAELKLLYTDGSNVSQTTYDDLYALIGNTFGSSTLGNFKLPDSRSRMLLMAGSGSGLTVRSVGNTGGFETITLTLSQIPSHRHSVGIWVGNQGYTGGNSIYSQGGAGQYTDYQGGDQPHDNMPPYLVPGYLFIRY